MFYFGMAKVIPTQFPPPSLVTLVEPAGNLSLSAMLWTSIGASKAYEMVTGVAEVAAGILLVVPRTTTIGALVALADLTLVFVLNMTYDVGLKQISFHLILLTLFLLAPEAWRLFEAIVLGRAIPASRDVPLFATARANRRALIAQLAFGLYLLLVFTSVSLRSWYGEGGPGAPKSVLYGIWNVRELSVDGQVRPVETFDYDRQWRRLIFDAADLAVIQRSDDSFAHYRVTIDSNRHTIELRKRNSRIWKAAFTYEPVAPDRLTVSGEMDGHAIRAELRRVELDTFRLLNSSFRWIHPGD
jgi:hypothetical protein